jgi:hypothetical protein
MKVIKDAIACGVTSTQELSVSHIFYHAPGSRKVVAFTIWYDRTWPQARHVPGSSYSSVGIHPITV